MKKPIITNGYTNNRNEYFPGLKVIAYNKNNICGNLGKYVAETDHTNNPLMPERHLDGVYIFQSKENPNVAYRIYKTFADYGFDNKEDAKLVSEFIKRQKDIKLSKLPTGIVTLENKIIGQEIPYFEDSISMHAFSKIMRVEDVIPTRLYIKILKIIKELYQNGIYYLDNHSKNFLVLSGRDYKVEIIDFDSTYVKFDEISENQNKALFENLMSLINSCNDSFGLSDFKIQGLYNFDDVLEQIMDMETKIKKLI